MKKHEQWETLQLASCIEFNDVLNLSDVVFCCMFRVVFELTFTHLSILLLGN